MYSGAVQNWATLLSEVRLGRGQVRSGPSRSAFQQDADLVVFSAAFRRLQDKTQVHPLSDNDHVRTRLTHSIEVASVGRSLATAAGAHLREQGLLSETSSFTMPHAVHAACLAHDIGNPPFGHGGEDALRAWFRDHPEALAGLSPEQAADLLGFEGNAQGLRAITRLENYRDAGGLRLTFATLGAFMKYTVGAAECDRAAPEVGRRKSGFHQSEAQYAQTLRTGLGLKEAQRHPLAYLTEAADDICYAVIDVEDGVGLGLIDYADASAVLGEVAGIAPDTRLSPRERIQKLRGVAIGVLVEQASQAFVQVESALRTSADQPPLLEGIERASALEACKQLARDELFGAPPVTAQQTQGQQALHGLLEWFVPAAQCLQEQGFERAALPQWARERVEQIGDSYRPAGRYEALLGVVDHIAGMTDRYALRLYTDVTGI